MQIRWKNRCKVQMMLTEGEDYSSQLSVHIFSTCTHLP
jgi:hypothetical protein